MNQVNILVIYSYEKAKKELTAFLNDNGFTAIESFHEIEEINAIQFYPDVAIIQTAIDSYQKNALRINEKFSSVQTFYWNSHLGKPVQNAFTNEELKEILNEKKLLKREALIKCIQQIQEKPFSRTANRKGNKFYKLDLKQSEE